MSPSYSCLTGVNTVGGDSLSLLFIFSFVLTGAAGRCSQLLEGGFIHNGRRWQKDWVGGGGGDCGGDGGGGGGGGGLKRRIRLGGHAQRVHILRACSGGAARALGGAAAAEALGGAGDLGGAAAENLGGAGELRGAEDLGGARCRYACGCCGCCGCCHFLNNQVIAGVTTGLAGALLLAGERGGGVGGGGQVEAWPAGVGGGGGVVSAALQISSTGLAHVGTLAVLEVKCHAFSFPLWGRGGKWVLHNEAIRHGLLDEVLIHLGLDI